MVFQTIDLALSHCKLWAVGRQTFQAIMMRAGMQKQTEHLELLRKSDPIIFLVFFIDNVVFFSIVSKHSMVFVMIFLVKLLMHSMKSPMPIKNLSFDKEQKAIHFISLHEVNERRMFIMNSSLFSSFI